MSAKEYLQQIRNLDSEINAKLDQCDLLRTMATRLTTTLYLGGKSGGGIKKSNAEKYVVRFADLSDEINRDIDRLIDLKSEAIKKINKVDIRKYRVLLLQRYVNVKTWEKIAVDMDLSYVHVVHNLHPQALRAIEKFF